MNSFLLSIRDRVSGYITMLLFDISLRTDSPSSDSIPVGLMVFAGPATANIELANIKDAMRMETISARYCLRYIVDLPFCHMFIMKKLQCLIALLYIIVSYLFPRMMPCFRERKRAYQPVSSDSFFREEKNPETCINAGFQGSNYSSYRNRTLKG